LFNTGGLYGNILRYVAVVVNTTLTGPTLKYTEGLEASKKWEEYMQEEVRNIYPKLFKIIQPYLGFYFIISRLAGCFKILLCKNEI
jgi:hypothetical protein